MRTSARFDTRELHAYREGYYTGVIYALRVAEEAIRRFKVNLRTRRAERRQKRSA